jgi:hypothetical protein
MYKELNALVRDAFISESEIACLKEPPRYPDECIVKHNDGSGPKFLLSRLSNEQLLMQSRDMLSTWVQIFNPALIYGDDVPPELSEEISLGPFPILLDVPDTRPYLKGNDHHPYLCSKPKEKATILPCVRDLNDSLNGGSLDEENPCVYVMPLYGDLAAVFGITTILDTKLWECVGARFIRYLVALALVLVNGYKEEMVDTMEGTAFLSKRFFGKPTLFVNMAKTLQYAGLKVNKETAFAMTCMEKADFPNHVSSEKFIGNPLRKEDMKKVSFFCLNEFSGDLVGTFGEGFDFYVVPPDITMMKCESANMTNMVDTLQPDFHAMNLKNEGDAYVKEKWVGKTIEKKLCLMALNKNQY